MQQRRSEVLEMALVGLAKLQHEVQQELNQLRGAQKSTPAPAPRRHKMSAAGRKAIAEAQKKRWANRHQERSNG